MHLPNIEISFVFFNKCGNIKNTGKQNRQFKPILR